MTRTQLTRAFEHRSFTVGAVLTSMLIQIGRAHV